MKIKLGVNMYNNKKDMSGFHSVESEFSCLVKDYNFRLLKKLWYSHLIVLSKHLEGDFYCYIIPRFYKHDSSFETTLWVGPIDRPDDGLENLSANIKIQIGYNQTFDENFFKNCEKKIINLINGGVLNSLLIASKKELANPSVMNKRFEVYTQYFLPFYHSVIKQVNYDKKKLKEKKTCYPIIESEFSKTTGDMRIFFEDLGIKATKNMIWEFCYIFSV